MTPRAQMSVRSSTSPASVSCSGDMYVGDPSAPAAVVIDPVPCDALGSRFLEMPKSRTLTISLPSAPRVKNRFAGLRSRCRCRVVRFGDGLKAGARGSALSRTTGLREKVRREIGPSRIHNR